MGNHLAPSVLSAPPVDRILSPSSSMASAPRAAQAPLVVPEPPTLGTLPKGPKGRVLAASGLVYGGLLMAGLAVAAVVPTKAAPQRVVTVSLDAFEGPFAPPPAAAASAARAPQAPAVTSPKEEAQPVQPSDSVRPVLDAPVSSKVETSSGKGVNGGLPGGQAGGVLGGVSGGQAGGTADGHLGAVVAPRFDAAYLQNPEPDYPSLSKRFGEEGRVILRVLVNPEGQPEQVEIRQSSGHVRLDQAALGTVRRWRFTPARRGAERLAAWVLVPLSFQLDA